MRNMIPAPSIPLRFTRGTRLGNAKTAYRGGLRIVVACHERVPLEFLGALDSLLFAIARGVARWLATSEPLALAEANRVEIPERY